MKKLMIYFLGFTILVSCGQKIKLNTDPLDETFFKKARLIMSRDEVSIYKHLPDNQAKAEFVKEFWEKRDPTPDTEENEARDEFYARIAYANRWFHEGKGGKDDRRGWDSLRGRIYIQLGHPENRAQGNFADIGFSGRLRSTKRVPVEIWYYYYHQMRLTFVDNGYGEFSLLRVPATLGTALGSVQHTFDFSGKHKHKFKYKAKYNRKDEKIEFTIPTNKLSYNIEGNKINVDLHIKIYVYQDYQKIDVVNKKISLTKTKDEILSVNNLTFSLPFSPGSKGRFSLDIIVQEKESGYSYRRHMGIKY